MLESFIIFRGEGPVKAAQILNVCPEFSPLHVNSKEPLVSEGKPESTSMEPKLSPFTEIGPVTIGSLEQLPAACAPMPKEAQNKGRRSSHINKLRFTVQGSLNELLMCFAGLKMHLCILDQNLCINC